MGAGAVAVAAAIMLVFRRLVRVDEAAALHGQRAEAELVAVGDLD
jgi:hypothetical protein